jgi:putative transposase
LMEYDEVRGIDWEWQDVDGAMTKSPFGGAATGANPTDRGKLGVKRSLLTDADGIPLGLVVDGANRHDSKLLTLTLDAIQIRRPRPNRNREQHLCLDKGYDYPAIDDAVFARRYIGHISRIGTTPRKKRRGGWSAPTVGSTAHADCSSAGRRKSRTTRHFWRWRALNSSSPSSSEIPDKF